MLHLSSVLDSLVSGVAAIDRDGRIMLFNDAAARILGIEKQFALGKHILQVIPNAGLVTILETGKPEIGGRQVIGQRTVLTNRSPIVQDGTVVGAVSIFQDITEMERISRELDSTKTVVRTLEDVLAGTGEWVAVVDANGIITMMSEDYAAFNGVSVTEAVGKHVTEVIENTRLHVVARTGMPELGETQRIRGQDLVVNRIPLKDGDRVVGAHGRVVFKTVDDLRELAFKLRLLESKVRYYEQELTQLRGARYTFANIVGAGPAITAAKAEATRVSRTDFTVLLLGETGTGKEIFAHAIHAAGRRRSGPFIKVNCAAIPSELLESELFGYEEGAFTGARKKGKPGKFEMADLGTLFLDEIADMPLPMQAKLLRVLQEREVERVGGTDSRHVDIRVIAATGRGLEGLVQQGKFRQDLYYRIHVVPIHIPPLRERAEDIEPIAEDFLARIAAEAGEPMRTLSAELVGILRSYHWPGNVRELRNVLERALTVCRGDEIRPENLPRQVLFSVPQASAAPAPGSLAQVRAQAERNAIVSALRVTNGNKSRAAALLGIHRVKLYDKLKRYCIDPAVTQ